MTKTKTPMKIKKITILEIIIIFVLLNIGNLISTYFIKDTSFLSFLSFVPYTFVMTIIWVIIERINSFIDVINYNNEKDRPKDNHSNLESKY